MTGTLVIGKIGGGPELAALIEDRRPTDWVFGPSSDPVPETLYKARVDRIVPGAAFVDLGAGQTGYLREAKGLKPGAFLLVEVTARAEPGKAVPVSTRILYRQRYAIHTPGAPGVNVARGIAGPDERARLTGIVADHLTEMEAWLERPQDPEDAARVRRVLDCHASGGTILRSAARARAAGALTRDLGLATAARIDAEEALADAAFPVGRIAMAPLPRDFALREWGERIGRIVVGPGDFATLPMLEAHRMSPFAEMIEMVDHDLFDHFGVWDEIERLKSPRVELPSGGWMAIESTRAMVTVDVNTADQFSGGAGLTANIEAARELPRQLRLRGLGGQVTIDFAPLKKMHRRQIDEALKAAFRNDPIQTTLAGWTPLGNFELQRKRERRPLSELS